MAKEKSPTAIGLGDLVLPGKKELRKSISELHRNVNPVEVADDILGPFYEIVGNIKRGMR